MENKNFTDLQKMMIHSHKKRSENFPVHHPATLIKTGILAVLLLLGPGLSKWSFAAPGDVLVTVNRKPITQADLDLMYVYLRTPQEKQQELKEQYIERLIDEELIRQFLKKKNVYFDHDHVTAQIDYFREKLKKSNQDPDQAFKALGLDEKKLREKVTLAIRWHNYARKTAKSDVLRKYFQKHHEKFDGTQIQAKQIFLNNKDQSKTQDKIRDLKKIKAAIESGQISFSDAAKKYSEAPSAKDGGDLGKFSYRSAMPEDLTEILFQLKPGEISDPVQTRFGLHLYLVTEKIPGELSLEDVRNSVLEQYSNEIHEQTVKMLRSKASIRRNDS